MGPDQDRQVADAVAAHGERLYRAARYLLNDERDAEDLCQATFLELCRSLEHFEGRSSLYTWLYRIMLNLYYRRLRRLRLERQCHVEPIPDLSCSPPEPQADVERRARLLREAIRELPRIYQTVIILHYLGERSALGAAYWTASGTVVRGCTSASDCAAAPEGVPRWT